MPKLSIGRLLFLTLTAAVLVWLHSASAQIASLASTSPNSAADLDLVIVNGRILDGSGNRWFVADVGFTNGKITEIGKIDPARAKETIDAKGLIQAK